MGLHLTKSLYILVVKYQLASAVQCSPDSVSHMTERLVPVRGQCGVYQM